MPIRRNGSATDPYLAEAFNNIAGMFRPPTGSELSGYASAANTRAVMLRQQKAFENIQAGRGTAADYAAAGIANPSQNYALADMYRRAREPGALPQDFDAGAYVVHGNANNTFEGQRRKNAADERVAVGKDRTAIITKGMEPIAKDAVRVVPPAAMGALGYDQPQPQPQAQPQPSAMPAPGIDPTSAGGVAALANSVASMFSPAVPRAGAEWNDADVPASMKYEGTRGAAPPGVGAVWDVPPSAAQTAADEIPTEAVAAATARPRPAAQPTAAPGMTQYGNMEVGQGQRIVTPDGRIVEGAKKPMSETEFKGSNAQRLADTGVINDEELKGLILDKPGKAAKVELRNYQTPDGQQGSARFDPDTNNWVDVSSGQPLPQGSRTYGANLTGGVKETGFGPTTANNTDANKRGAEITRTLDTLDLYEQLVRNNPGVLGLPGLLRGTAQNAQAVVQDIAQTVGKSVPQVQAAAKEIETGLRGVAPEFFDKSIPEAEFYQGTIAYALARSENPTGEVSREAFKRALERVSGGILSNPQQVLSTIGAFRKSLQPELNAQDALRNPTVGRKDIGYRGPTPAADPAAAPASPAAAPASAEKWARDPQTGKIVKVQ